MNYELKDSGLRIKKLRKEAGYTQETFAAEIGISHRTYAGIESGAHGTSIDTLINIAEALDTTLDYLVCGKSNNSAGEIDELLASVDEDKKAMVLTMIKGMILSIS